ncbi:MAG: hydrogenase maturation nickel metallochaperone HypA [Bryobacteraceae bacterium]
MHETSLIPDLLEKITGIARENKARRVIAVELEIGALAGFSPEHLREHFEEAAKGTVAEGAELRSTVNEDPLSPEAGSVRLMAVEVDA